MSVFEKGYDLARQEYPNNRIILVSHEYAITQVGDPNSQILDYAEHLAVQNSLKKFTRLHQNSLVIFPYAFSKEYQKEHQITKLKKIEERFQGNVQIKMPFTVEEENFFTYKDKLTTNRLDDKITVVRNVCYLFSEGSILSRVDKRAPVFEYTLPSSSIVRSPFVQGSTFFQPGTNRNIIPLNETQSLAIEICADHACGLLKSTREEDEPKVDYHLIVANSTSLKTENLIGKFNILCDAVTGTSLMQIKEAKKEEAPIVIAITLKFNEGLLECTYEQVKPEILNNQNPASRI